MANSKQKPDRKRRFNPFQNSEHYQSLFELLVFFRLIAVASTNLDILYIYQVLGKPEILMVDGLGCGIDNLYLYSLEARSYAGSVAEKVGRCWFWVRFMHNSKIIY